MGLWAADDPEQHPQVEAWAEKVKENWDFDAKYAEYRNTKSPADDSPAGLTVVSWSQPNFFRSTNGWTEVMERPICSKPSQASTSDAGLRRSPCGTYTDITYIRGRLNR
ncbi:unnamed protein product [Jaminaea pallidilutea]